ATTPPATPDISTLPLHDALPIFDISDANTPITGQNGHPPDGEPDGISPYDQLDALAAAGGKPLGGFTDFYQTQNELELQAAIQAIVEDAVSCTLFLDPTPAFPDLVEVEMDGETVPRVDDCESEDGWVFSDPDGPHGSLELCGSSCEQINGAQALAAKYYGDPGGGIEIHRPPARARAREPGRARAAARACHPRLGPPGPA